jgi:ABC-type multidrug transport system ATPase subunit
MPTSDVAIDVQHLTRHYHPRVRNALPVVANDDLSFRVPRGECFGLLGPNGAGKTTLICQLLGILAPTSGQIRLGGVDVVRDPERGKRLVGYLPQSGLAMRSVEVERALRYTGRLRGQSEADARAQARAVLDELELVPYAGRSVNRLSGGLARLAYFAMALMGRPPILILDEPTNELDPHKRRLIWDVLARRHREQGTTCVLVTHNVLEAEKVLQRVGVMQRGRMIAIGTPGELKQRAGAMVRLEFWLKDGAACTDEEQGRVAALGALEQRRPGHYRLDHAPAQCVAATERGMHQIGRARLDDFRLTPPSLEDVYLELDQESTPDLPLEAD